MVCCVIAFLLGLLFVQRSGNYFVTMFDDYSAGLPLTVVVILENISVAWIYGTKRYSNSFKAFIVSDEVVCVISFTSTVARWSQSLKATSFCLLHSVFEVFF